MRKALHDLAQPLTAMECRLSLNILFPDEEVQVDELLETIHESLAQCRQLMVHVRSMQDRLN